jgi:DNA-directed RNA polymerase specialized sigma24 family protein
MKSQVALLEIDQAVPCEESLSSKLSDHLTKDETEILVRFYEYRQSINEISAHYHITESACKMRLKRARGKVKKKIKEIFY